MSNISKTHYKGFILAAGRGSRLRPFTDHKPKPLLPFAGVPILHYQERLLAKAGIKETFINCHYKYEQILQAIKLNPYKLKITPSVEKDQIYGTGGAFAAVADIRQKSDLIVVNGDIITDFDVQSVINRHEESNAVATMALLPEPHPGKTKIWCLEGRIVGFGGDSAPKPGATPHGFACLHILSDCFLQEIRSTAESSIIDYYRSFLEKGAYIAGTVASAFFHDLGTPGSYWNAHKSALTMWNKDKFSQDHDPLGILELHSLLNQDMTFFCSDTDETNSYIKGPSLITSDCQLDKIRIGPYTILNKGIQIGPNSIIQNSLVLSGSNIECNKNLVDMIVDQNCEVKIPNGFV